MSSDDFSSHRIETFDFIAITLTYKELSPFTRGVLERALTVRDRGVISQILNPKKYF